MGRLLDEASLVMATATGLFGTAFGGAPRLVATGGAYQRLAIVGGVWMAERPLASSVGPL